MTREEKKNLLGELIEIEEKNDIGNLTRSERAEFQLWIEKIIETLEKEPCEDAVSRQQAIFSIRNLYPGRPFVKLNLKKWQEENKKYFECENIIKALPSVTPTRRKGG